MSADQVEELMQDKAAEPSSHSRDVARVLAAVKVKSRAGPQPQPKPLQTLKNFIADEPEPENDPNENVTLKAWMTGLVCATLALGLAAMIWMMLGAGEDALEFLAFSRYAPN